MVTTETEDGVKRIVSSLDLDRFRFRAFVERLAGEGEIEVRDAPVALAEVAAVLDGNSNGVLFTRVGPEQAQLAGNVMGSRTRLAKAFGVPPDDLMHEVLRRLRTPQPIVTLDSARAPVHQIIQARPDADLTALPAHLQHGMDGGPYISSSIDYVLDPKTGWTNVGVRRMMLRGPDEAGIDLVTPSDLRAIYEASVRAGERLPVSFVVGSHPIDHVAATMRIPMDELALLASLRGAPLPVVRCITNDLLVPADAEFVLEGYFDERGYVESEGPYGEFLGYYGGVKQNPVFHLTAITRRQDALFQTSTISGRRMKHTDSAQLVGLRTEVTVWRALETAVREPVAVHATTASGGMYNLRIALRQRAPGEARNAIAAAFGCLANVKHVFVVDEDIDVFSDEQIDWALATRFQADRDLVVQSGFRTIPLDPSLEGRRTGSKAGFDLTFPPGQKRPLEHRVPTPPSFDYSRFPDIASALADAPKTFEQLMAAIGSRDGRDVVRGLDTLRKEGRLARLEEGYYALRTSPSSQKGR